MYGLIQYLQCMHAANLSDSTVLIVSGLIHKIACTVINNKLVNKINERCVVEPAHVHMQEIIAMTVVVILYQQN